MQAFCCLKSDNLMQTSQNISNAEILLMLNNKSLISNQMCNKAKVFGCVHLCTKSHVYRMKVLERELKENILVTGRECRYQQLEWAPLLNIFQQLRSLVPYLICIFNNFFLCKLSQNCVLFIEQLQSSDQDSPSPIFYKSISTLNTIK